MLSFDLLGRAEVPGRNPRAGSCASGSSPSPRSDRARPGLPPKDVFDKRAQRPAEGLVLENATVERRVRRSRPRRDRQRHDGRTARVRLYR